MLAFIEEHVAQINSLVEVVHDNMETIRCVASGLCPGGPGLFVPQTPAEMHWFLKFISCKTPVLLLQPNGTSY